VAGFGRLWVAIDQGRHRHGLLTRIPQPDGPMETFKVAEGPIAGVAVDMATSSVWVTVCPPAHQCGLVGPRIAGHAQ
jgi:hypothetical protein